MSSRGRGRGQRGGRGGARRGIGMRGGHARDTQTPSLSSTTNEGQHSEDNVDSPYNQLSHLVSFEKMTPLELTQYKSKLLNTVSASLIKEPRFDSPNSISNVITFLVKKISYYDPEFIMKLALYTRDDLGIRTTTNYLVALASNLKPCQPFIRRFFKATIKLPSDWLDVAATYQMLPDKTLQGGALPTTMRKAMTDKFPDFDAYQLAKYNKEGSIKRKKKKLKLLLKKDPTKAAELQAQLTAAKPVLTIKQMIRQLHVSEPAYSVMCIIGKKYPLSDEEFRKYKLPGAFEPARAGKRMKLPVPETWETLVSAKGNKASTWEELIEHKKLPFMAMLRNLRNLLFTGVQPRYHRWVMNKLTNEETIAQSKQFPFRFFSAYEVIPKDLNDFKEKLAAANEEKAKKKSKAGKEKALTDKEKRKMERRHLTPQHMPDADLFDKYRAALDTAVKHATTHNVKPIRGTTAVFCNTSKAMQVPCGTARGLGKFSQSHELGILLGLMCKYVCEECDFRIFSGAGGKTRHEQIALAEGTILENMAAVSTQSDTLFGDLEGSGEEASVSFPFDYVEELIRSRRKVDNLIILSHQLVKTDAQNSNPLDSVSNILHKYRQEVNPDLLFVSVDLSGRGNSVSDGNGAAAHPNDVMISGFSDSILRFIAERGDNNQLHYVEHIDEAKKIPKDNKAGLPSYLEELEEKGESTGVSDSKEVGLHDPTHHHPGAWRTARVFISSTFLDMHGERDLLTRHVFPELRERCKARKIHLFEVDLRWGITEEESQSDKQLEMCLDQVDRCRPFFVGLLGRRYGYVPKEYKVGAHNGDPRYDWVKEFPAGRSVTELEMFYGALKDPSKAHALFYMRDPTFNANVPLEYRKYFEAEGKEQALKVDALKQSIRVARGAGITVWDGYPCKWAGVVDGKPMTGGLEHLRKKITDDLWAAICKVFPQPAASDMGEDPLADERHLHDVFAESHTRKFVGRQDILDRLTRFCDGASALTSTLSDNGSGAAVVVGQPGCGKSAIASAFVRHYRALMLKQKKKVLILTHFIGSSPSSTDVRKMLARLSHELVTRFKLDIAVPEDYTELKRAFADILKRAAFLGRIVLVIDGLNQLDPLNRSHTLDWLPSGQVVPIKMVLTTLDNDNTVLSLRRRKPAPPEVLVGPMELKDRKELVRVTLAEYHKRLDERPMNDQMRVLLKKTDAVSPLYLVLACEELRVFGVYEQLSDRLKFMAMTLVKLLDEILHRLEGDHGKPLVSTALSCIACARGGLTEIEITTLLRRDDRGEERLADAVWSRLYLSFSPFFRPVARDDPDATLDFFHRQMHHAIVKRYLETGDTSVKTHRLLARYFLRKADPTEDHTWQGDNVRAMSELPYHLTKAKMWKELESVLTDLRFVEKKSVLGLTYDLIADYAEACNDANSQLWPNPASLQKVKDFWRFVSASSHVIAKRPHLTFQQAANQPDSSTPATLSTSIRASKQETRAWIQWLNKPQQYDACKMTLTGFAEPVLACAVSRDGTRIACASRDCSVKVFDFVSGVEVCSLIGHTNWVVDCAFSSDGRLLVSASWDNTLRLWDVVLGGEIALMKGHARAVNACRFSPDGKEVVSGSWDTTVKVWDTVLGNTTKTLRGHSKPVNAVAYAPNGKIMASASWDGTVRVWNMAEGTEIAVLKDATYTGSLRDLDFAPTSRQLVTANVNKSVCLWDVTAAKLITILGTHSKPVTGCAYSTDGKLLASASDDNTVKVWAAVLGKELAKASVNTGWMNCVAFTTDGTKIATGTSECTVKLWDSEDLSELATLTGHSRSVACVAFSPVNNNKIVSGSDDGTLRMWEISGNNASCKVTMAGHRDSVGSVAFSVDGSKIASGSDDFTVKIWDGKSGAEIRELQGHANIVRSVAFSPNGKLLASASRDCNIRLWQVQSGQFVVQLSGHLDWINCVSFSPDSNRVVSSSWDYNLKVWDVRQAKEVMTLKGHASSVEVCVYSADGKQIVSCGYDGTLKVWDAAAGSEITTLQGHSKRINGIALSKATNQIASVSDDSTLRIWDSMAGTEVATLVGHAASVRGCAFAESNYGAQSLVSVSDDCTAKVWDVENVSISGHAGWVTACAFSNDGSFLASASEDGTVKVWDISAGGTLRKTMRLDGGVTRSCVFTNDNSLVVGMDDNSVRVLDWKGATRAHSTMRSHSNSVRAVATSADSRFVAAAGWDTKVIVWDFADPANRGAVAETSCAGHSDWVECVALSRDGRLLASGGRDNVAILWERIGNTKVSFSLKHVLTSHTNWITSVAFSPDGKQLVSASYDLTLCTWDTASGHRLRVFHGHTAAVSGVAFTPTGGRVLSVAHDNLLHIWGSKKQDDVVIEFVHAAPATAFAFSPAAKLLASGDSIGNIYLLRYNGKQT